MAAMRHRHAAIHPPGTRQAAPDLHVHLAPIIAASGAALGQLHHILSAFQRGDVCAHERDSDSKQSLSVDKHDCAYDGCDRDPRATALRPASRTRLVQRRVCEPGTHHELALGRQPAELHVYKRLAARVYGKSKSSDLMDVSTNCEEVGADTDKADADTYADPEADAELLDAVDAAAANNAKDEEWLKEDT